MGEAVEHFSYDKVGNRKSDAKTGTNEWLYNKNNELQSFDTTSFKYNLNGQMTEKTVNGQKTTYSYNLENRLSEIKDSTGQTIASYQYDPFERRISKTLPQQNKTYYYHYAAEGLVAEYNESGSLIQSYGYMPDSFFTSNPIFSHRPDFTEAKGYAFYINDSIGLPQKLITNTGRKIWESEVDAFGKITITNSEFRNPLGFPGQYFDEESGLRYNFKRYYDPELGRYIKSDPIGLFGGINSYGYTYGNPVTNYDPTGEFIPIMVGIVVRYAVRQAIRQIPRMMVRRGARYAMQGPKGSCPSPVGGGRPLPPLLPPIPPLPANPPGGQQDPSPFIPPDHGPSGTPGLAPPDLGPTGTPGLTPPNVAGPGAMISSGYRKKFIASRPDLPKGWQVHHGIPQRYRDVVDSSGIDVDDLEHLRGVDPQLHSKITKEWGRFHQQHGGDPTPAQIGDFAKQIDQKYGGKFIWPGL